MQGNQGNEVDDVIRDIKRIPGFHAYAILNNDGTRLFGGEGLAQQ